MAFRLPGRQAGLIAEKIGTLSGASVSPEAGAEAPIANTAEVC